MSKKIISIILSVCILTVVLSGCVFSSDSVLGKLKGNKESASVESSQTETAKSWPNNDNTKDMPIPDFGNISAVLDVGDATNIVYSGVSEEQSTAYLEQLKSFGFDQEVVDSINSLNVYYSAKKDDGRKLTFDYNLSGIMSVSINKTA